MQPEIEQFGTVLHSLYPDIIHQAFFFLPQCIHAFVAFEDSAPT